MCVGAGGQGEEWECGVGYAAESVDQCLVFFVFSPACFLDLYLSKCKTVKLGDQLTGTWAFSEVALPTTQQSRSFHNGEKEDEEHLREREIVNMFITLVFLSEIINVSTTVKFKRNELNLREENPGGIGQEDCFVEEEKEFEDLITEEVVSPKVEDQLVR